MALYLHCLWCIWINARKCSGCVGTRNIKCKDITNTKFFHTMSVLACLSLSCILTFYSATDIVSQCPCFMTWWKQTLVNTSTYLLKFIKKINIWIKYINDKQAVHENECYVHIYWYSWIIKRKLCSECAFLNYFWSFLYKESQVINCVNA